MTPEEHTMTNEAKSLMQIARGFQEAVQMVRDFGFRGKIGTDPVWKTFEDTIALIVTNCLSQVEITWQSNDPAKRDWDNGFSNLVFKLDDIEVTVMVKTLTNRGLEKRVGIKMNAENLQKTIEQLAQEAGVAPKFIEAAYCFFFYRWVRSVWVAGYTDPNGVWVEAPKLHRNTSLRGDHFLYVTVNGERIWEDGFHISDEERGSIKAAKTAVAAYESWRQNEILRLREISFKLMVETLLASEGESLEDYEVELFEDSWIDWTSAKVSTNDWSQAHSVLLHRGEETRQIGGLTHTFANKSVTAVLSNPHLE